MIAIIITLAIALIVVNALLAMAVRVIRSSHTRYIRDTEIAARLARVQAREELIQALVPLARKY